MLSANRHGSKGNQMAAATLSARRKMAKKALRRESQTDSGSITNITTTTTTSSSSNSSRRTEKSNAIKGASAVSATRGSFTSDAPEKSISSMTDDERSQLIKSMGENIDTRLQEIQDSDLAELDRDAKEEMQQKLLEEVRLAAGTEQRLISSSVYKYISAYSTLPSLQEQQQLQKAQENVASEHVLETEMQVQPLNGLPCVKVRHNCNSITALACLGGELVAFGDKTGNVYMVNVTVPSLIDYTSLPTLTSADSTTTTMMMMNTTTNKSVHTNQFNDDVYRSNRDDKVNDLSSTTISSLHVSGHARRKVLLQPTLPSSVLSIAISDTRHYRPSAREMFEKTNLDTSCVSYLAVGTSDGSIGI